MNRVVRLSVYHPLWVIAVITLISVLFALALPGIRIDSRIEIFIPTDNPVRMLYEENRAAFDSREETIIGMVADSIYTPGTLNKIHAMSEAISAIPLVDQVTSILTIDSITGDATGITVAPLVDEDSLPQSAPEMETLRQKIEAWDFYEGLVVTPDARGALMAVTFEQGTETDAITPVYHELEAIADAYRGPEHIFISGVPVVSALTGEYMLRDMQIFVPFVNLVIIVSLLIFFRRLVGVVLPLLTVSISTLWTFGLMALLGIPITTVTSALPVILVALGSAYGIHVLESFLSEYAGQEAGREGVVRAVERVSAPVIMAGLTTMAGFASLLTSEVVPIAQLGLLATFGTGVAFCVSLSLIPAILSLWVGPGSRRVPGVHSRHDLIGPILGQLSRLVRSHSRGVLALSALVLALSLVGSLRLESDMDPVKHFRTDSPLRQADDALNEIFGGTSMFNVVIQGEDPDAVKDPEVLHLIDALQRKLAAIEGVGKAASLVDLIKRMNQAMHAGDPAFYTIPESRDLVAQYLLLYSFAGGSGLERFVDYDYRSSQIVLQLKSQSGLLAEKVLASLEEFRRAEAPVSNLEIFATGIAAITREFNRIVIKGQIASFITSLVLVLLITTLIFRSLRLGAFSLLPLCVPIILNFAVMGITGITLNAATAMIACVTIGVGIDYSIHLIARWRHEVRAGHEPEDAIYIAIGTVGRAIFYNALAVAAGFLVLLPSKFVPIVQMGLLTALVMLASAVAAVTLLPAALKLSIPYLSGKERYGRQANMAWEKHATGPQKTGTQRHAVGARRIKPH